MEVQTQQDAMRLLIAPLHPCCLLAMEVVILSIPASEEEMSYSWHLGVSPPNGESAHERGGGRSGVGKSPWDLEASPSLQLPSGLPSLQPLSPTRSEGTGQCGCASPSLEGHEEGQAPSCHPPRAHLGSRQPRVGPPSSHNMGFKLHFQCLKSFLPFPFPSFPCKCVNPGYSRSWPFMVLSTSLFAARAGHPSTPLLANAEAVRAP